MASFFEPISSIIVIVIDFFYGLTVSVGVPNYGIAIVLFTILFKTVLYPLTVKQMKSMRAMQVLGPRIKELQAKHKKDPQKAQQAMMELYKKYNVNPLAGCLPILVQMPILIALFWALRDFPYIEQAHATFLWIGNLSNPDPWLILPVLAGASTFIQMRTTSNTSDQMQKIMLYTMPLVFAWISATFAAGLALYWTVFSIMGAIQQHFINKKPLGIELEDESEEDSKEDDKREGKQEGKNSGKKNGKKKSRKNR